MNIFAIEGDAKTGEIDWVKSAQSQDNYRVVKMILESCQILSTVLNEQGFQAPYRSFNPKHPSCLWAAESSNNFANLVAHTQAMLEEYTLRFGKTHKCEQVLAKILEIYDPGKFATNEPTPLKLAMPDSFKHENPVLAYRKFYASKPRIRYPKNRVPKWFPILRGTRHYQEV